MQYKDRIRPEDRPATAEYAKAFNDFQPKKVEVNEATVEEVIRFGQYIAEATDIYKTLGDDTFYGPEELPDADPQDEQRQ